MHIKNLLIILAIFGAFLKIDAQSLTKKTQDSLLIIWKDVNQPDTLRLKAIGKIAWEGFRFKNPDSAFYYAQLQYDFASSIKNKEYQVLALNIQGDFYLLKGDPDKALDIFTNALKLSENLSDKKVKINALGNISRVFESKGNFEKALEYHLQILKISEEIEDQLGIGISLLQIGRNYVRKGDLTLGLDHLSRAKKIFVALNNQYYVVKAQSTMAPIYMQQGNPDEALKLFTLNLAYFEETGNKTLVAACLSNIAGVYARQGNNKKALENLEKALGHFEEMGNIPYIAGLSQNMGRIYQLEGNLKRSLEYYNKALKLSKQIKDKNAVASANNAIGIIHAIQGNNTKAINYITEALTAYQKMEDVLGIKNTSKNLVKSYKATGNYKKALEMNELFHKMRDSLTSKENQKAFIELQVQSDYDKQKAIDDIENKKEIAIETQKTNAQRNISIAIGVALLLISLLAFIIFNRLKVTRQQKAIIEEQKKKVEQSEKYKEQFLANMSHEIRTPMHAISGMIKILKRNDHPKTQDVFLKAMQTSSDNLVVILNDVLDLSKIEAGKLDVESIPMNPRLVIENVYQILKFRAEEKGLKLSYKIDETVPSLVTGDPSRLNQILINLIGNAIKFTENGTIAVSLLIKDKQLQFQVQDTGIGISKEEQQHIFKAFEQAKGTTTRFYGGTGLGLSISKQLVALQKGTIWLESKEGEGSTFYVSLPLINVELDAIGEDFITKEKLIAMANSLQGIRVLIAEDNPFNQMIAKDDLNFHIEGIHIEVVENGSLAVEKFKTENFDLILMDVQMPEMNGFEATKNIREIEKQEGRKVAVPIIAMTASLLKTEIDSCYQAGMDNYIPKPYTTEELIKPIFIELRT